MTKSRELDEEPRQDADVNKRHYGEDVKFYFKSFGIILRTWASHSSQMLALRIILTVLNTSVKKIPEKNEVQ